MIDIPLYMNTWKRFVNEGILDQPRISKRVEESWYRSKHANVNPYLNKAQIILKDESFHKQKEKNSLFLTTAKPYIKKLYETLKDLDMMALLIDPEGYVLSITGNKKILHEARKINFVEGVLWTEQAVGTNAIGTALQIKEAVMINATEHYSIASHSWSCSAAPVRNVDGTLLGIIDISCPAEKTHPFMLGMAASIADSIERELSVVEHKNEIELIQQFLEEIKTTHLLVICNNKQEIVSASPAVQKDIPNWPEKKKGNLPSHGYQIVMEKPIFSKRTNQLIGHFIYLSEISTEKNHVIRFHFHGIQGNSKLFKETLREVELVANTDATVYILGETGTGKELIAKAIHENSSRKNKPFIAINCGAIPRELMESELFGYVEGAFTGANRKGKKGKFEQANGGTIFLDEIGEIPHTMQVAILRVLQERTVTPVGGTKEIPLDIRIITATHRDLSELVNEGKFRNDLYYRLHVYPIYVPSLRERREDIPHFIHHFCQKNKLNLNLTNDLINQFLSYDWPGNIRELLNVLERLRIQYPQGLEGNIKIENLLHSTAHNKQVEGNQPNKTPTNTQLTYREKIQKDLIVNALKETKGNVTLAAKQLDIPRSTFYKRLKKFGL